MIDHPTIREELVQARFAERLEHAETQRLVALAADSAERSSRRGSRRFGGARIVADGALGARRRLRVLRWLAGTVAS